jgi:hypothetical protein
MEDLVVGATIDCVTAFISDELEVADGLAIGGLKFVEVGVGRR